MGGSCTTTSIKRTGHHIYISFVRAWTFDLKRKINVFSPSFITWIVQRELVTGNDRIREAEPLQIAYPILMGGDGKKYPCMWRLHRISNFPRIFTCHITDEINNLPA